MAFAADAGAQGFGIGPRVTFNRGDASLADSTALRMLGGQMKLRMSPKTAIELAMDFRSELSEDLQTRVRDMPIQASLLFYPVSTTVAPYVIGGLGWYSQNVARVDSSGTAQEGVTTREMGYHAGLGAEIRAGKHVSLHGDYRYTFLGMGEEGGTPGAVPLPGTIGFQERLKLSHQGSMWNWGATFFF
jgi:opacity protein-like surface antigen